VNNVLLSIQLAVYVKQMCVVLLLLKQKMINNENWHFQVASIAAELLEKLQALEKMKKMYESSGKTVARKSKCPCQLRI